VVLKSLFFQAQTSSQKRREQGNANQHKAMREQGNEATNGGGSKEISM
jgi:hypothetical protein